MRILDHLPIGVLAVIAACGSFNHIAHLAERSGQDGWMSYATAVCIDLLAVVAAGEIRRDKRMGKRSTIPTFVLAGAICLTLGANLAEAQPTVWGRICAGVPAGAFLLSVALIERRGSQPALAGEIEEEQVSQPVQDEEPTIEPGPAPKPKAPKKKTRKPASQKPPKSLAELLILAQEIDEEHREKHGKRVSRDVLRAALGVSTNTASSVLRELRTA